MKEIVVISGKGGTGKTSITACFASLAKGAVLADCDVDAADLHLILQPQVREAHDFVGGKKASVIADKCIGCGRCADVCNFEAVVFDGPRNDAVEETYRIDAISCEGCGVCAHFCPVGAMEFADTVNGEWLISDTRFGPMVHARLGIAEENSGKLVTLIRKQAKQIAEQQNRNLIIVDGSPGIGCPVIASMTAADLALIVTEPTLSGVHDLERVAELSDSLGVKGAVCINKADLNPKIAVQIEKKANQRKLQLVGRIHYDEAFTKAQLEAKSVAEFSNGELRNEIVLLWEETLGLLN